MAQINPRDINYETECYAAVHYDIGFRRGRLKGWKLYSLENPTVYMILSQRPDEIMVAFETSEELEQWYKEYMTEPEPEEVKLKTVGSGPNKLIISQIL